MDLNIQNCLRTAAIVYAEGNDYAVKRSTTIKKYIEAVFTLNGNQELSLLDLLNAIETDYKISFTETELLRTIKDVGERSFLICDNMRLDETKISLTHERFMLLSSRANQLNYQTILDNFISKNNLSITGKQLEDLLGKFFYYLLNTNIEAYSQILKPTSKGASIAVPQELFSPEECELVNSFLDWNDVEKNKQIICLISLAIEFAFLSNNIDAKKYCRSLSNKVFYLDTNLIFRGLGINGEGRKKRVNVFLDKCRHSGQKICISKFTRDEFFNSIDKKILLLEKYPFGESNPEIFSQYGIYDFYRFYHEWRKGRITNAISLFRVHLTKIYNNFCEKNAINEDYSSPFDQDQSMEHVLERYSNEIIQFKSDKRQFPARTDALNAMLIEKRRGNNDSNIIDTKYYLITADHGLKKWDDTHSQNQPIMLLPSQWLGLVFKYTGRATEDDFQCFMSFLRLKVEKEATIDSDRLQIIVAGISEISNDFSEQKDIVDEIIQSRPDLLKYQDEVVYAKARDFALKKVLLQYQAATTKTQEFNALIANYENIQKEYRQKRIDDIQNNIAKFSKRKEKADKVIKGVRYRRLAIVIASAVIFMTVAIVCFVKGFITTDGPELVLLSLAFALFEFLVSCFLGKEIRIFDFYIIFTTSFITTKVYDEYDICLEELEDLENEKDKLIKQGELKEIPVIFHPRS